MRELIGERDRRGGRRGDKRICRSGGGGELPRPPQNELREHTPPAKGLDRGRQLVGGGFLGKGERLFVDIAERQNARQQRRVLAERIEKREAESARRPPVRQINRGIGEREWVVPRCITGYKPSV